MSELKPLLQALPALAGPSIVPGLGVLTSVVGTIADSQNLKKQQSQDTRDLQRRQAENLRAAQQNAATERATIKAQAEEKERKRRDALKRAVARQRVSFGAGGLRSGSGGSSNAVLLGLFDESDAERQERERLDKLRLGAIDQNIGQLQRSNLIARSDLAERQSVARAVDNSNALVGGLSTVGKVSDLAKTLQD